MSNEQIATIVAIIAANWVSIGPVVYKAIQLAWTKSIEWQDMLRRIADLEKRVEKNEKDINAAHLKLRE